MKKAFDKHFVERLAVLFLIFSASGTSLVARSYITWDSPFGPALLVAVSVVLVIIRRIEFDKSLAFLLLGYFFLFLVQALWFGSFHPKHMLLYPLSFVVAYIYLKSMRERLFVYIEDALTWLAVIGLFIWSCDVLSEGGIRSILSGKFVFEPYDEIIDSYVLVYTVVLEGVESFLPRNAGFAWEPGAFSVFCCLALMINMARMNFRVSGNIRAQLLITTIVSTQSTTGYTIMLAIFAAKALRGTRGAAKVFIAPIIAMAVALVLTLPFMQEKILDLWDQDAAELSYSASQSWNLDKPVAAQRFLSLKLDLEDFAENPLLGYGGRESEMGIRKQGLNIVTVSGIGKIFAKFGVFGFIFFATSLYMSSRKFDRTFDCNSTLLLLIVTICIAVSYSLVEHPLMMCFWMYWNFTRTVSVKYVAGRTQHSP